MYRIGVLLLCVYVAAGSCALHVCRTLITHSVSPYSTIVLHSATPGRCQKTTLTDPLFKPRPDWNMQRYRLMGRKSTSGAQGLWTCSDLRNISSLIREGTSAACLCCVPP